VSLQWDTEVRPVLDAVYRATREHPQPGYGVEQARINDVLGRDPANVSTALALDTLVRTGYLVEGPLRRMGTKIGPGPVLLTEKALAITAGWPTSSGEALLSALIVELDRRIEAAEPDEKSKLERFREFAIGVGRDVMVGFLTAQAQRLEP
jgi:hypothetical protein